VLIRLRLRDEADVQLVRSLVVRLPSARGAPLPSPTLATGTADGAGSEIWSWRVDGLVFEAPVAAEVVAALDTQSLATAALGDDLRYWAEASRFVLALLCRQRLLPAVQQEGGACRARWLPLLTEEGDAQAVGVIARAMPPASRALAWDIGATLVRPEALLRDYLATVVDAVARQALHRRAPPLRQQVTSRSAGSVTWLRALRDTDTMRGTPATLARLGGTGHKGECSNGGTPWRLLPARTGASWCLSCATATPGAAHLLGTATRFRHAPIPMCRACSVCAADQAVGRAALLEQPRRLHAVDGELVPRYRR
jgi:hypothetical protein